MAYGSDQTTHYFMSNTSPTWGHAIHLTDSPDNGMTWKCHGHSLVRMKVGDLVIMSRTAMESTRYKVTSVRYERDPPDQFFAELEFFPRKRNE